MVQFLSINIFSWISSIFVGFFKSSHFYVSHCSIVHYSNVLNAKDMAVTQSPYTEVKQPTKSRGSVFYYVVCGYYMIPVNLIGACGGALG